MESWRRRRCHETNRDADGRRDCNIHNHGAACFPCDLFHLALAPANRFRRKSIERRGGCSISKSHLTTNVRQVIQRSIMIYTCPMHPQIQQDHPGHCPICGMTLEPMTAGAGDEEEQREVNSCSRKLWIALVLTIPVLIIAMGHTIPALHLYLFLPRQIGKWIEFGLTTPVVLWAGGFFFTRAWQSIINRSLNM